MGRGRVFVLGDTSPLHNEMLANAYPFVGRLLAYLAHRPSSPQALWRQLLALAAIVAMLALLAARPAAWQLMLTPSVMAVSLTCCTAAAYWSSRVLPDGRSERSRQRRTTSPTSTLRTWRPTAATAAICRAPYGIAGLLRTLMRQGYLPLLAPDLTPERLERCGLLISIGPAREFSPAERAAVQEVRAWRRDVYLPGRRGRGPSQAPAVGRFRFQGSALAGPAGRRRPRAGAAGRPSTARMDDGEPAIPVLRGLARRSATRPDAMTMDASGPTGRTSGRSSSAARNRAGRVVVIGDTHFAGNENLETASARFPDNILFWRWLLSRVVPGQKAWNPPPGGADLTPARTIDDEEDATRKRTTTETRVKNDRLGPTA